MKLNRFIDEHLQLTKDENRSISAVKNALLRTIQQNQDKRVFTLAENYGVGSSGKNTMIRTEQDLDLDIVINIKGDLPIQKVTEEVGKMLKKDSQFGSIKVEPNKMLVHFTFNSRKVDLRLWDHVNYDAHERDLRIFRESPKLQRFVMLLKYIRNTYYDKQKVSSHALNQTAKTCFLNIEGKCRRLGEKVKLNNLLEHFSQIPNAQIPNRFFRIIDTLSKELEENNHEWATVDKGIIEKYRNKLP